MVPDPQCVVLHQDLEAILFELSHTHLVERLVFTALEPEEDLVAPFDSDHGAVSKAHSPIDSGVDLREGIVLPCHVVRGCRVEDPSCAPPSPSFSYLLISRQ